MFNSDKRYGAVAMLLHWLIAFAIIGMIILGLYMTDLPNNASDKFYLYQLHKSIGLTILGLSVLRLAWRLINPIPHLPAHLGLFERVAAHLTHYAFYGIMIGLPFTGWMMVSVSPLEMPTLYFEQLTLEVPHLPAMEWPLIKDFGSAQAAEDALKAVHKWLAYGTIALLVLHIAAAMFHALILNDDVLRRMLPWTGVGEER